MAEIARIGEVKLREEGTNYHAEFYPPRCGEDRNRTAHRMAYVPAHVFVPAGGCKSCCVMLPAESDWIRTLKLSQSTNEELRVGSFAAHMRFRLPDLTEITCAFFVLQEQLRIPENTRDWANRARN